jgi:predicted lipoprotein with Yx(FWY)xxD motif
MTNPDIERRQRSPRPSNTGLAVASLAAVALALAACGSSSSTSTTTTGSSSASVTVKAASTDKGTILETSAGMPLYTLTLGTSCTGACASAWPFLTVPAGTTPKAGPGVTGMLGTTTSGGALVVTYNGKKLYTFTSDSPGQVTGDGVAGFSVAKVTGAAPTSTATTSGSGSRY